jgi:hypothetical protein
MTHLVLVLALLSTLVVEHDWAAGPVGAVAPAQKDGADGVRERTGLRGARYCEIFVITGRLNQIRNRSAPL